MKTFATLFSGGELFGVGAQQAGFRHLWGVEYDDKIASVARLNGFNVITGDVRNIALQQDLPAPDHLHASPPCPNFSVAKTGGKEQPEDVAMAEAVCWFIEYKRPKTFSLENVIAYRKSQSLARIVSALQNLGYMIDIQNLNAADFGVPQTRRRMILRASRLGLLRPYPKPVPWVGWYTAIEDILDTLPDSQFAPWQIARLPKEYKDSFILRNNVWGREERGAGHYFSDAPSPTVIASTPVPKAFIVNTQESHGRDGEFTARAEEEPISTIAASAGIGRHKAFIVDGQSTSRITVRDGDEPSFSMTASADKFLPRAQIGRVVKMTVQALGRFQTVPDDYKGITVKINGNGVPCLMARRIMESML